MEHYSLVFDAVYTPKLTRLLQEAQESGAAVVYGTEMLVNQAFEQYERFTGSPGKLNLCPFFFFFTAYKIFLAIQSF